jgi:hypothetical protein
MDTMRTLCLAMLACLALAACDQGPTFDASSLPAYQKSLGDITEKLSIADQRKLEMALFTLTAGDTSQANAIALANPTSIANLMTLAGVANPLIYLDRLRPAIDGKSAAAVIRLVAANLDDEISRAEAKAAGAERLLTAVAIENPRYYWDRRDNIPTIEFSVSNGSKNSISRIYVTGVLTERGRAGKWTMGGLNYWFEGGLQPGEQMPIKLTMKKYSAQTGQQLASLYDADFTLKLTNVEDAHGQKVVPIDTDVLEGMRAKRDFLRGT